MQQSLKTQMDSTRYFRVGLVEKAAVPQGAEGDNWCCYVLESGVCCDHGLAPRFSPGGHATCHTLYRGIERLQQQWRLTLGIPPEDIAPSG